MRVLLVLACASILCGCADLRFEGFGADSLFGEAEQTKPTDIQTLLPVTNEKCAALARQRETSAASNGYNDSTQHRVFFQTYADCVAWDPDQSW